MRLRGGLAVLGPIRVVLRLGEVRDADRPERLRLGDDGDALGDEVQVLVERQGDSLRHLQGHGNLEVGWVQAHHVLAGKLADTAHVLAQVLEVAVLLAVAHHRLHGFAELFCVLHCLGGGVLDHMAGGSDAVVAHKGSANVDQVLVFGLALHGVDDAAVQHQQAGLSVGHYLYHDVAWKNILRKTKNMWF